MNPTSGAVSTAPSKNVLLNISEATLYDVNFPHTTSAKKLATKNPTITGTLSPIANTTGINGVSKAITGAALTSSVWGAWAAHACTLFFFFMKIAGINIANINWTANAMNPHLKYPPL